jgi:phospholipase A1
MPVLILIVGSLSIATVGQADELTRCMTERMRQAGDETTIGELRRYCQDNRRETGIGIEEGPVAVVSDRLREDKRNVLAPFTLMTHKPNYVLLAAYNSSRYDPEVFRRQYNDDSLELDDTEAQFQISIKTPLALNLFDTFDIYAAYTNRSFWQVYNKDSSSPFRETNHEPEVWAQFNPNWEFLGFRNTANTVGIVHQSNGNGGLLSRSWNRVFANLIIEKDNLALSLKPWFRIPEDEDNDDNPDITDYLGHYEVRGAYKWGKHVFSGMSRNNLESGFSKGAVEVSWSFPLGSYPYMQGYLQYFSGYGESLIDYDQYTNRIGIGLSLTDWL